MKRTLEDKRKELGQAWHYLDPYPWPEDLACNWAFCVFQDTLPRSTEHRIDLVRAAIEHFAYDSEIKYTRELLAVIEKEAQEHERNGRKAQADAVRAVAKKLIDSRCQEPVKV